MANSILSYCGSLVRQADPDRYFCSLFSKAQMQEALFAIYAFNCELAHIPETVTQPVLGMIRLQWWRDQFAALQADPAHRPVHQLFSSLADAITIFDLPHSLFETMLNAREEELLGDAPETLEAAEDRILRNGGSLMQLATHIILGGPPDEQIRIAGEEASLAYGLTGLLYAVRVHARLGRVLLPRRNLAVLGLTPRMIIDQVDVLGLQLRPLLISLAERAEEHSQYAKNGARGLRRAVFAALLPVTIARLRLQYLRGAGYDLSRLPAWAPTPGLPWRLAWHYAIRRL